MYVVDCTDCVWDALKKTHTRPFANEKHLNKALAVSIEEAAKAGKF